MAVSDGQPEPDAPARLACDAMCGGLARWLRVLGHDTFYREGDFLFPAPAPRFSRTTTVRPTPPGVPGADTEAVLDDWV